MSTSPGYRLLSEKRKKLQANMTLAEVDAVMVGLARHEEKPRQASIDAEPFLRPHALEVTYDKPNANEGDYTLTAYFDKDGLLVGKRIWGLMK